MVPVRNIVDSSSLDIASISADDVGFLIGCGH